MPDLDPATKLAAITEQAATLDALLDIAESRGVDVPGIAALLGATLADAERLAASLVGGGGPEAGEA